MLPEMMRLPTPSILWRIRSRMSFLRGTAAAFTKTASAAPSCVIGLGQRLDAAATHLESDVRRHSSSSQTGRIHSLNVKFSRFGNHHPKLQYHPAQQQRLFTRQAQDDTNSMTTQEMASLQTKLLQESSYLTRTLYRRCLQSVKLLAGGNRRDEEDFVDRENQQLKQFDDDNIDERISMAPPVNRGNELASRANYYKAFTRENFDGHWSLLGKHGFHIGDDESETRAVYYMWREEQIEQFVYLIRSGEERRQWVLTDYEFEDPCKLANGDDDDIGASALKTWPAELAERLEKFEAQSNSLVKEMYRRKGWTHSSGHVRHVDEDDIFSDSDSDDDV